jgi:hypothetical protein
MAGMCGASPTVEFASGVHVGQTCARLVLAVSLFEEARPAGPHELASVSLYGRGSGSDGRKSGFLAGTRAIVESGHRAFGHSPLNAALDRLMMQSEPAAHCKKRRILSIRQQYPRPLDPACRF